MRKRAARYFVGVDIGGSKIMAGLFDAKLRLLDSLKVNTKAHRGATEVLGRVVRCVTDVTERCNVGLSQVAAIGVGTPGVVDYKTGRVLLAPNLGWKNVKIKKRLRAALKRPLDVENDCLVAMRAIYEIELKRKPQHVVGIFLGTGIGGALVFSGQHYRGGGGVAGEIGHMIVDADGPPCVCGGRGCFELYASRTGIVNRLRAAVAAGEKTSLFRLLEEDRNEPGALRSGLIKKAFEQGDALVRRVVKEAAEFTGVAIGNLVNLLTPEVVVLGGGVVEALEHEMLPVTMRKARERALFLKQPKIIASNLGDKAGITGAAVLARRHYQEL